ncbi:MAG: hypothetical protein PHR55_03720 [Bacilli bacterium]|nr:hypothetical protein [Bacilli bacterium]MDD4831925.1 hypothetical protein [Bacilli bacterium]
MKDNPKKTLNITNWLDKNVKKINLFFKRHPFLDFIKNCLCFFLGIILTLYITNTDEILANGFASIVNCINQKTEEVKSLIENNNNEICNSLIENKWTAVGKNIEINQNYLLFRYEKGYKGDEAIYNNKIEFNDSKDLILQLYSQNMIDNDVLSILLKDEIGNNFLKIETSKLDIKIFTKNNGEWIENQKITYGRKIENHPIFYFKLSISKDGNHFRISTVPKHKDYLNLENEFINEKSMNADIILNNVNYMNNIQLGIGVFTSLQHDIDIEIHDCKILK